MTPELRQVVTELRAKSEAVAKRAEARAKGGKQGAHKQDKSAAKPEEPRQGEAVVFVEVEPWPEAVDGAALLDELLTAVRSHVVMAQAAAVAVALWVLHAWTIDSAQTSPRLALTSPEKRCGKTTALKLLGALCNRVLLAANLSAAVLFRAIAKFKPTLLVDEADSFLPDAEDLRGVINCGHDRAGAVVLRCVGEQHEAAAFPCFGPVAIAAIGRLPATIEDRAILVRLQRAAPGERIAPFRRRDRVALEPLRRRVARWAMDNVGALADATPELPDGLNDREADSWEPLLAIADRVGGAWPERARAAAQALAGAAADDSLGVEILADIRHVFGEPERMSTSELLQGLVALDGRPWAASGRGDKPLSSRRLARLLQPFGLAPSTVRNGEDTFKGYRREWFADAWRRYLPAAETGSQPSQRHNATNTGVVTDTHAVTRTLCDGYENGDPLGKNRGCDAVTDTIADREAAEL